MFRLYDIIEQEPLVQEFNLTNEAPYVIKGFYPYLYMKNQPIGTYIFKIIKEEITIFEKYFNSADIQNSMEEAAPNAYVFFPILPEHPYLLLGRGRYKATLEYYLGTTKESSHLGWIRLHKFEVNEYEEVPEFESDIPFAMKVKVLERP